MKSLCGALLIALALTPVSAIAGTEACLIQVDGKIFVNKPCTVERDPDGSLRVNMGSDKSIMFFAYINPDAGAATATGWWNEEAGYDHARTELGTLSYIDGCWVNAHAKVCARGGSKPSSEVSVGMSPEVFVKTLYAPYFDPHHDEQPAPDFSRFLEPSLARLWKQSRGKSVRLGEMGPTSGDWICDCKDGDISDLQLVTLRAVGNEASIVASFRIDGKERKIRYDLQSASRRWQIREMVIEPRSESLKRELVSDSRNVR